MLYKINSIKDYALNAIDGQIGKVNQFYFDDVSWEIRYAVVDTGKKTDPTDNWFTGRQVLLPPANIKAISAVKQMLDTNLTRKEIEESPATITDRPVSKQTEEGGYNALGWPVSWYGPEEPSKPWDPNLRSTKEVTGYHVQALDGELGHIEDFILDDVTWTVRYLILDTRNWWPGKKVLIAPPWIKEVCWEESKVYVTLTREQIQQAPEFISDELLTPDYEAALSEYYGGKV